MANGIKALRKIQIGAEASYGGSTDVVTTIWRGTGVLQDNREVIFPDEDIGIIGAVNRSYIAKSTGEITLEGDATYEQLPYIFNGGLYLETASTDTGSGYIYQWTAQNFSTDPIQSTDLQTYVIEGGDNNEAELMRAAFVREFGLSGAAGESLTVSATLEGREITGGQTFTAGTSLPAAESILFSKGKLYIDDSTGTIGTTLIPNALIGIDFSMTTGWMGVMTADGRIDTSFIKRVADEITMQITFEHNATATAEKAAWRAQTERAIRVLFIGDPLTSAGAYTYKTFIIDLWGKWESFDSLGDQDGNDTVTGNFRAGYSTVAGNKAAFTVVNDLSALP